MRIWIAALLAALALAAPADAQRFVGGGGARIGGAIGGSRIGITGGGGGKALGGGPPVGGKAIGGNIGGGHLGNHGGIPGKQFGATGATGSMGRFGNMGGMPGGPGDFPLPPRYGMTIPIIIPREVPKPVTLTPATGSASRAAGASPLEAPLWTLDPKRLLARLDRELPTALDPLTRINLSSSRAHLEDAAVTRPFLLAAAEELALAGLPGQVRAWNGTKYAGETLGASWEKTPPDVAILRRALADASHAVPDVADALRIKLIAKADAAGRPDVANRLRDLKLADVPDPALAPRPLSAGQRAGLPLPEAPDGTQAGQSGSLTKGLALLDEPTAAKARQLHDSATYRAGQYADFRQTLSHVHLRYPLHFRTTPEMNPGAATPTADEEEARTAEIERGLKRKLRPSERIIAASLRGSKPADVAKAIADLDDPGQARVIERREPAVLRAPREVELPREARLRAPREVPSLPAGHLRTFEGHEKAVTCVAYFPDGLRVITGSEDGTLRVWDTETKETTLILRGHGDGVLSVAVSPDGRTVLSGSRDATIRVWDAASGRELRRLEKVAQPCWGLAFAPGGKDALCCAEGEGVNRYEVKTGRLLARHSGAWANTVAAAPGAEGRFLTGGSKGSLLLWEPGAALAPRRHLAGHRGWLRQVALSADGKRSASVSGNRVMEPGEPWLDNDSVVVCLALPSGTELARFTAHTDTVTCVAMTADGGRVLSGSADGTIRLFDVDAKRELAVFKAHGVVRGVALSPDGRYAISCGLDKKAMLWHLP